MLFIMDIILIGRLPMRTPSLPAFGIGNENEYHAKCNHAYDSRNACCRLNARETITPIHKQDGRSYTGTKGPPLVFIQ